MFFAKQGGSDFNIKDSQENKSQKTPSTPSEKKGSISSASNKDKPSQQPPQSILNQAGMNILGGGGNREKRNSYNDLLDNQTADRIVKGLQKEGGVAENLFKKPPMFKNSPNPIQPNLSSQMSGKNIKNKQSSSDNDMISIMAQRLQRVEQLCQSQREELREKSEKIIKLEDEVDSYKKADTKNYKIEVEKLKKDNNELQQQVNDMEIFLNKYGLKWRGNNDGKYDKENKAEAEKLKEQLKNMGDPKYKYNLPKEIDINIILRRIEDLNYIQEKEGSQKVVKDKQGIYQFQRNDPLPIGFYSDGIVLKGFPFFPYGSNQASQILADVLDGYFPYQLKKSYPNGTLLKVIDKTDQKYTTEKTDPKFGDLSGKNNNDNELKPMSKEEFLSKLPKQVIKNGRVIDVRDDIAKKFDSNNEIETKENLAKQQQLQERANQYQHKMEDDRTYVPMTNEQIKFNENQLSKEESDSICLLKIRTETGKYIILLRLFAEKKISEVYQIVKFFSETDNFQIMDNTTREIIPTTSEKSLEDLDFHPNAVLTLMKKTE